MKTTHISQIKLKTDVYIFLYYDKRLLNRRKEKKKKNR